MDDRTCKSCRHFDAYIKDGRPAGRGDCMRYPPTPVCIPGSGGEFGSDLAYCRPEVRDTDWCGEFRDAAKPMSAQERIAAKKQRGA